MYILFLLSSEVQYIVLSNIASLITIEHRNLFEPYLRSFFIFSTDSLQVKLLKLEILSSLITETSSSVILREFQVGCFVYYFFSI